MIPCSACAFRPCSPQGKAALLLSSRLVPGSGTRSPAGAGAGVAGSCVALIGLSVLDLYGSVVLFR